MPGPEAAGRRRNTPIGGTANRFGRPQLSISPSRIDRASASWTTSRKPLVGEFGWFGLQLFVIANYFNSKGGSVRLV